MIPIREGIVLVIVIVAVINLLITVLRKDK